MSFDRRTWLWLFALGLLVAVACVVHIAQGGGSKQVGLLDVVPQLIKGKTGEDAANVIVWNVRLPRMLAALLAGAILGSVGAAFQAYFRNPLAEPYVIGVSSGAGLGGTLAFVLGVSQAFFSLGSVLLGFLGGLLSLWLVLSLAGRRGGAQVHTLLLAGVVVGAMLSAFMTTVLLLAGEDSGRVLKWLLGNLGTVFNQRLWAMAVVLAIGLYVLQRQARPLNAFSVGEFSAERLGVDPKRLRRSVLLAGTAMVSVAVGTVGIIGFLGLMAPHAARRTVGIDLRACIPASAMLGSVLLMAADLVAQNLHRGIELPVGAVTAILGAPLLLLLLKREG